MNEAADHLSHLRFKKFLKSVKYRAANEITPVPDDIWPMEKIWLPN